MHVLMAVDVGDVQAGAHDFFHLRIQLPIYLLEVYPARPHTLYERDVAFRQQSVVVD